MQHRCIVVVKLGQKPKECKKNRAVLSNHCLLYLFRFIASSEEESDSDNEWSKMQAEQKLKEFKAFYTLGCEVTEVSKTALFSEVGDISAADSLKPLKVIFVINQAYVGSN